MKSCWIFLLLCGLVSAQTRPDPEWDAVFQRNRGWNGADGAYSVLLNGGWTGWLFSDTFVGPVDPDGSRKDNAFIHNSWARIESLRPTVNLFSNREVYSNPTSPNAYWVYQPVLDSGQKGWIFFGEFSFSKEGPEGLNFKQVGNWLAPLDWSGTAPKVGKPLAIPHFQAQPALNFGAAVLEEADYFWVYGTRDYGDHKELLLARVPGGQLDDFASWEFWPHWSHDVNSAQPLLKQVSNELSVFRVDKEFRLLTQVGTEVRYYRGLNPDRFEDFKVIAQLEEEDGVMTYNAKAHPELGWPLLITYNRNAFPPQLVLDKADRYRPRCLRLDKDPWQQP
ncbi:DUF5005 domain-containing protein [bacterium]|nr:DUF5005 domain-containing protein [bacterium]